MKQVICINPKSYNLTQGREYEVANEPVRGFYNVINDNNSRRRYHESMFRDVVIPITESTPEEISESLTFTNVDNNILIKVEFNIDSETKSFFIVNSTDRLDISCGINTINGIQSILNKVISIVINRGNLRALILSKILLYIFRNKFFGMMLISTNINFNNMDLLRQGIELLRQDLSIDETTALNPNSGNNIVLYTIYEEIEEDDTEDIVSVDQVIEATDETE